MKRKLFYLIAMISLFAGQSLAQKVLLPFGQFDKQSWTATCFSAASLDAEPENWYAKDFDDSSWTQISGPISTASGSLPYYNYEWDKNLEYGCYWTRRHFTIDDLGSLNEIYLDYTNDDEIQVYLNGSLIYSNRNVYKYPSYGEVLFDESAKALLVEGDNVIAVRVYDSGGTDAYMDYGLYAFSLSNGNFSKGSSGWSGNFDYTNRNKNRYAYGYRNDASCSQVIADASIGLYRFSANACGLEYNNNQSNAVSHKDDPIPTVLYINDAEQNIPSVFTEPLENSYRAWNVNGKYIPYDPYALADVINENMFKNEVWCFYDAENSDGLNVGIRCKATDNVNRWAAWDNMDLDYYDESDVSSMLTALIANYSELNKECYDKQLKAQSTTLLGNAANTKSFKEKSLAFIALKNHDALVRKSIEAYISIRGLLEELRINIMIASEKKSLSPSTLAEAIKLQDEVYIALSNGEYEENEISAVIAKLNQMIKRFGYAYLDVTVGVPGSLGDSILFKVENFVDVQSLKVSGSLNNTDLNLIKNNLSHLKELDIENTNVTEIPDNLFSQHSALELIKLPSGLKTIGEYAFNLCTSLDNLELPASLTTIKTNAFRDCDNLTEIYLNEGLKTLASSAFYSCGNLKYVKFPSTLITISSSAFKDCSKLEKVDFSDGLYYIEGQAFSFCSKLDNIVFPNTLYYINSEAFFQNTSLRNIVFNEGLYRIYDNAFYHCDALTEVTLPSTLVLAYESPFDYCDNLKKVTCLSLDPPHMTDQIPYGVDMDGRELYVPALAISTYKQHETWSKFPTIKPIDQLPENITVHSDLHLTLPESIPSDYKPNIDFYYNGEMDGSAIVGSLTVNGSGSLSLSSFNIDWSHNNQRYNDYNGYNNNKIYCSLLNNTNLSADKVYVNIMNNNDTWTFITIPFNAKVSDIVPTYSGSNNWIIRRYDGGKRAAGASDQTWVKMNDDDIMNAGEGYIMQSSRYDGTSRKSYSGFEIKAIDDDAKNNIFIKDDATVALKEYESEYSHSRSWNLIGNPYPCYYDTRFMDFTAPITVWNMRNSTYSAYSPVDDAYVLCPGEAFFVQRPVDNDKIVFSKDGRQIDRTVRTIETPARAYSANAANRIVANVSISNGVSTDRTRIVLNDKALMDYEMDKDASKFMSSDSSVPQIFSTCNGVDYSINERPFADGTADLDLYIGQDGIHSITLLEDLDEYKVMLEDRELSTMTELSSGSDFSFKAKTGDIRGRFVLHFVSESTGINAIAGEEDANADVYSIDGIKVKAPVQNGIYIKNGKKIVVNK